MRNFVALVLLIALLSTGCSDGITNEEIDTAFQLVNDLGVKSITPAKFTPGELTTLTLSFESAYSGLASVLVTGHGGGNVVGEMKSPVEASVGTTLFPLSVEAGKTLIPMEIEMLIDHNSIGFSISVTLDSLLVDGSLVHSESDEGRRVYWDDIPAGTAFVLNYSYLHVTVDRANGE